MDKHSHRPDDMSEVERRLSAWRPAAEGLDADAMLFAAGRAAAPPRRVRSVWPALTGLLAVLALVLGAWAMAERTERLALDWQLRQALPVRSMPLPPAVDPPRPLIVDKSDPDGWLNTRRALEQGLDAWPPQATGEPEAAGPLPSAPVLMVGQRDTLLDR